jgi:hypothetical protein
MSELAVPDEVTQASPSLYPNEPAAMRELAVAQAKELSSIIDEQKLYTMIKKKKHVSVEGWTTLGAMLGVFPVVEWSRELVDEHGENLGWEARVEARTLGGNVVGAAEAECRRTESTWKNRDSYAIRSMAQTRATSKALRLPLGFIMALAGYEATPTDEFNTGPINQAKREVLAMVEGDKKKAAELWQQGLDSLELEPDDVQPEHLELILQHIRDSGEVIEDAEVEEA